MNAPLTPEEYCRRSHSSDRNDLAAWPDEESQERRESLLKENERPSSDIARRIENINCARSKIWSDR